MAKGVARGHGTRKRPVTAVYSTMTTPAPAAKRKPAPAADPPAEACQCPAAGLLAGVCYRCQPAADQAG